MSELIPFKDKYKNEKIVLFAPGPTLNNFSYEKYPELKNVKTCAVNGVILHESFRNNLNIFIWSGDLDIPQHPTPSYNYIMEILPKLNKNVLKFTNCWTDGSTRYAGNTYETQISPDKAKKLGFIRYNQIYEKQIHKKNYFHKDLSPINSGPDGMSVAFHALQILLYMGFNEIILVGFDCGGSHSYKKYDKYKNDVCDWGKNINYNLIKRWLLFKKFLNKEYNNVNIKVINPVGLKNIFITYK